jgi:hypothetical protein
MKQRLTAFFNTRVKHDPKHSLILLDVIWHSHGLLSKATAGVAPTQLFEYDSACRPRDCKMFEVEL